MADGTICLKPEEIDPGKSTDSYSSVGISERTISKQEFADSPVGKRIAEMRGNSELGGGYQFRDVPDDAWIGNVVTGHGENAEIIIDIGGNDSGVKVRIGGEDGKVYDLMLSEEDRNAIVSAAKSGLLGQDGYAYSATDGHGLAESIKKALEDPQARCMS